jgi:hypothetical protein
LEVENGPGIFIQGRFRRLKIKISLFLTIISCGLSPNSKSINGILHNNVKIMRVEFPGFDSGKPSTGNNREFSAKKYSGYIRIRVRSDAFTAAGYLP